MAASTVLPIAAQANETGAPVGAPHPDAELLAACERHPALVAAWNEELERHRGSKAIENGYGPAGRAYDASRKLVDAAKPQTMAGVLAKARAAIAEDTNDDGEVVHDFTTDGSAWAWDVMMDVLRLAGG